MYFKDTALLGNPNPVGSNDSDNFDPWYTNIDYTYYINGDILSVVIIQESGGTATPMYETMAYNFSISDAGLLSYEDIANYAGYTADEALDIFIEYTNHSINGFYEQYSMSDTQNDLAKTYEANISWFNANKMPWFINEDGKLSGFIYSNIELLQDSQFLSYFTIEDGNMAFTVGTIKIDEGFVGTWFWQDTEETPAQAIDNELLNKLCNGYWVSNGYRFSDTMVYEFEMGTQNVASEHIEGTCYVITLSGAGQHSESYTLSDNVLTISYNEDIVDVLDYNAETGQFISRMQHSMVEQAHLDENDAYVPAQTQALTLTNQDNNPRDW